MAAVSVETPEAPDPPPMPAPRLDALFLLNCLSIGGSERKIVRLANRLQQRGVVSGIAHLNGPDTLASLIDERVGRWPLDRKGKLSFGALRRLRALIEQHRPRALFAVNLYPTLYVLGAAAPLGTRAPTLVSLVNTTDLQPHLRWRKGVYKRLLRRFDHVIYGCEVQRTAWLDPAEPAWARSSVIYNGVDLSEFSRERIHRGGAEVRVRYGLGSQSFVVGSVGRLVEAKNHSVLIDAVAKLRIEGTDARLLLIGEGALKGRLEAQAAARGIADAVIFTGNQSDVRPLLDALDVFVLPSLYVETFSNAALEAMAMGKPVVLSEIGGAREMVRNEVEGYVVPRDALEVQLPLVLHGLATDPQLRTRMGQAARRRVETQFSFEGMVEQYEQVIAGAVDGGCR